MLYIVIAVGVFMLAVGLGFIAESRKGSSVQ